jgi:hypothetical protein
MSVQGRNRRTLYHTDGLELPEQGPSTWVIITERQNECGSVSSVSGRADHGDASIRISNQEVDQTKRIFIGQVHIVNHQQGGGATGHVAEQAT